MSFHAGQTFTFGETPSATKWNYIWENDYALQDWSAYSNNTFPHELIAENEIPLEKINASVGFWAGAGSTTSVNPSTFTKALLTSEQFDYGSDFASSTFTAPVDGLYWFSGRADMNADHRAFVSLYKNGSEYIRGTDIDAPASRGHVVSGIIELSAGNTVDFYVWNDTGADITASTTLNYLQGFLIGER